MAETPMCGWPRRVETSAHHLHPYRLPVRRTSLNQKNYSQNEKKCENLPEMTGGRPSAERNTALAAINDGVQGVATSSGRAELRGRLLRAWSPPANEPLSTKKLRNELVVSTW